MNAGKEDSGRKSREGGCWKSKWEEEEEEEEVNRQDIVEESVLEDSVVERAVEQCRAQDQNKKRVQWGHSLGFVPDQ